MRLRRFSKREIQVRYRERHKEKLRAYAKAWYHLNKHRSDIRAMHQQNLVNWRLKNPKKYMLQHARGNAKERGQEFNITEEDIYIPEVCPIFGTPFEYKTPYAASIDRIDSNKGYVKGNVQIISRKANSMKQDASPDELKKFGEWAIKQSGS